MKSPFRHGQMDYLLKNLPLNVTVAAKRRPQMAGRGEQRCIENLEVGRLFFLGPVSRFAILFNYRMFTFLIVSTLM